MHDGMNWNNDLQRGQSLENSQHHLMIDGEPSITAFAVANRPTSVHRLGDRTLSNGIGSDTALTLNPPHRWSSSHLRRILLPERSNLFESHWSNQWLTNLSYRFLSGHLDPE